MLQTRHKYDGTESKRTHNENVESIYCVSSLVLAWVVSELCARQASHHCDLERIIQSRCSRPAQSSMGLSSKVTRFGSVSTTLLRLLSVLIEPTEALVGKLDRLPKPGLRVYRPPAERGIEPGFSNSLEVGAGVGVGVGESSETVSAGGGGGLDDSDEALALAGIEDGESVEVPLIAASVTRVFTVGGCSPAVGDPLFVGTSRLLPRVPRRSAGLELPTLIGKRPVSEAPLERSRRCRCRVEGLVARLRLTIAR